MTITDTGVSIVADGGATSQATLGVVQSGVFVGGLITVGTGWVDAAGTINCNSVTDTAGNVYLSTLAKTRNATQGYSTQQWFTFGSKQPAGGGANTITMTLSGASTFLRIHISEKRSSNGSWSFNPLDQTATATGNSLALATGAITPTRAGALVSCFGSCGSGIISAGAGFTIHDAGGLSTGMADLVQVAAGSQAGLLTASSSSQWGISVASFFDATAPGGGQQRIPPRLMFLLAAREQAKWQTPAPAAAVTGTVEVDQRTTTAAGTTKGGIGGGVAAGRATTADTSAKGASAGSSTTQHTATAAAGTKTAGGTGTSSGRAFTTATGVKGAAGGAIAATRATTADTTRKQATGASTSTQHSTILNTGAKGGVGSAATIQRTTVTDTANKPGGGTANAATRATSATTGRKGGVAAGVAAGRPSVVDTGRKQAAGGALAPGRTTTAAAGTQPAVGRVATIVQRTTVTAGGRKGGTGAARAICHPSTATAGNKAARGSVTVAQRSYALAIGANVPPMLQDFNGTTFGTPGSPWQIGRPATRWETSDPDLAWGHGAPVRPWNTEE